MLKSTLLLLPNVAKCLEKCTNPLFKVRSGPIYGKSAPGPSTFAQLQVLVENLGGASPTELVRAIDQVLEAESTIGRKQERSKVRTQVRAR